MAWHLLEKMMEQTASHSTIFGKWWIAFVFIFRIIVVASIGDNVYLDEQEEFVCNTESPGCEQVCYNKFAPISQIRFWSFQILLTCTPTLVFIVFAMHRLAKVTQARAEATADEPATEEIATPVALYKERKAYKERQLFTEKIITDHKPIQFSTALKTPLASCSRDRNYEDEIASNLKKRLRTKLEEEKREREVLRAKTSVVIAYVVHVIARTAIEAVGLYGQYLIFGWTVPEIIECQRSPCLLTVHCYVSRPKEKELFMLFMFGVGVICMFFNIIELLYLAYRRISWTVKKKKGDIHETPQSTSNLSLNNRPLPRRTELAPPGYYIPDVEPPLAKSRIPAKAFPMVRVPRGSYTSSSDDDSSHFMASDEETIMGTEHRHRTFNHY